MLRRENIRRIIVVLLMTGFVLGIIYANVFAKKYILSMGIFSEYFLDNYSGTALHINEYLLYIIKMRMLPVLCLIVLGCTKYKKLAGSVCLLWTGFSLGVVFTTAVLKLNIKGLFLCLIAMCPHFICYIAAYFMLLIYLIEYPNVRWNHSKTVSFVLFMLLGIVTESYINPVLMDIFIKAL